MIAARVDGRARNAEQDVDHSAGAAAGGSERCADEQDAKRLACDRNGRERQRDRDLRRAGDQAAARDDEDRVRDDARLGENCETESGSFGSRTGLTRGRVPQLQPGPDPSAIVLPDINPVVAVADDAEPARELIRDLRVDLLHPITEDARLQALVHEHDYLRLPSGAGSLLAPRGPENEIEPTVVDIVRALEHAWVRMFRSSESSRFRSFTSTEDGGDGD